MRSPATRPTAVGVTGRELSLGQEALWFLQNLAPDSSAYNASGAVNLHFPVDVDRMARAVRAAVSADSMLNCVFAPVGGRVRRRVGPAGPEPALDVHEVAGDDDRVREFALAYTQRPFRLDRERPVRMALLRRPAAPDLLVMAAHHIAVDNISQMLVLREILAGYATGTGGAADPGAAFDDLVSRQRSYLESPRADADRAYWRDELAGADDCAGLPGDLPRPAAYRFAGSQVAFTVPAELMTRVGRAAEAEGATTFAYLFTAFQLLLYAYGRQTRFLVGYPVTLRSARRFRDATGYFVNTLPFCARVDPDESFGTLLHRTGGKLLRAMTHREFPFALMPRLVALRRDPDQAGLVSTMFVLTTDPRSTALAAGHRVELSGHGISEFPLPQQQGQFDVTLELLQHEAGVHAQLKYNTSLFTARTARALADGYLTLLRAATGGTLTARLGDVGVPAARPDATPRPDEGADSR